MTNERGGLYPLDDARIYFPSQLQKGVRVPAANQLILAPSLQLKLIHSSIYP